MNKLLDLISEPISVLHNDIVSGNKNAANDYIAYVTTYANICRLGEMSEDDKRALKGAAISLIKEVPNAASSLKKMLSAIETKGSDEVFIDIEPEEEEELVIELDEVPEAYDLSDIVLGEGEKKLQCISDFVSIIGGKFNDICKYIELQMQKYKIPGLFMYRYEHDGEIETFRLSLNESLSYDGSTNSIEDDIIILQLLLDIIDYTDYEAVNLHSSAKFPGKYDGFDYRIKFKSTIKDHLNKAIEIYKDSEDICKTIEELDKAVKLFDSLISPDNKDTCIKNVINFVASIGKDKKIESLLDKGDTPIRRAIKYVSLYS